MRRRCGKGFSYPLMSPIITVASGVRRSHRRRNTKSRYSRRRGGNIKDVLGNLTNILPLVSMFI